MISTMFRAILLRVFRSKNSYLVLLVSLRNKVPRKENTADTTKFAEIYVLT